jgi:uncharacterized membrane protein
VIDGNEITTLLLGIGVLIFLVENRDRLRRLPAYRTFFIGFLVLEAGWLLTVLEGYVLGQSLNLLEHICYVISSLFICSWCWQVFVRRKSWC